MSQQAQSTRQTVPAGIVEETAQTTRPIVAVPSQTPARFVSQTIPVEALSPAEMTELQQCERTIEQGIKTFLSVGKALHRVQEGRLYRGGYATFELYLDERWGLSRSRAYQLIDASKVAHDLLGDPLLSIIVGTMNEGQARELVPLRDPEMRREAARLVAEDLGQGKITAKAVRAAAARVSGKPRPAPKPRQPQPEPCKADKPVTQAPAGHPHIVCAGGSALKVSGTEPAVEATHPWEKYVPADHPLTEAVREVFRSSTPVDARLSVDRLLASDPSTVTLDDVDNLIRRCGWGGVKIGYFKPQEALAIASA